MIGIGEAKDLAESKLAASLPRRWRHFRSFSRRARWVAGKLALSDDLVMAACDGPLMARRDQQRMSETESDVQDDP